MLSIQRLFQLIGDATVEPFWPCFCLLCRARSLTSLPICHDCMVQLPWRDEKICSRCGVALFAAGICGRCLTHPPSYTQVIAPFHYTAPIDQMISSLKFSHRLVFAHLLGWLFVHYCRKHEVSLPAILIPVPLHPHRQRARGFNQALEIAKILKRPLGIALAVHCCVRRKETAAQAQLAFRERRKNMRNAFAINKPIAVKQVVLLDDVVTTGETVEHASRQLLAMGVQRIDVWCIARAERMR